MLVRALLQTSLVLWLAQQTLQGGVKPQSVSWGRVLPARGVGIGVKPGVVGALGALGNRYGNKAMKSGIGRYPAAALGVGGYRSLGLGGRTGLKQGAYGTPGAYGASLGTGMGLTNGLGMGGKRVYGTGVGTLPGYGSLAGMGYPGARQGAAAAADLGESTMASLGHGVQDVKGPKNRALGPLLGKQDKLNTGRSSVLHPTAPELQTQTGLRTAGAEVRGLDQVVRSPSLGSPLPADKHTKGLGLALSPAQGGENYSPTLSQRRGAANHGAMVEAGRLLPQTSVDTDIRNLGSLSSQSIRIDDSSVKPNLKSKNCGTNKDLTDRLEIIQRSEGQRSQGSVPQFHIDIKDRKYLGHAASQAQRENAYQRPVLQPEDVGGVFSVPQHQGSRNSFSAAAEHQGIRDLGLVGTSPDVLQVPQTRISIGIESSHGTANLHLQGMESSRQVVPDPSGTTGLGVNIADSLKSKGFVAQEEKHLFHAERDVRNPKALSVPGHTGKKNQAPSYLGGPGNYLGASLGAGGYGAGLGQGAYLGGAAGKLGAAALGQGGYPEGAAGKSTGYGDGVTGYLGAMAGNGYGADTGGKVLSTGYGNGYGDSYGAGLGFPAELTDVAESKTGKSKALSTGAYAGQVQGGAYGALGTGLDPTGGKYGGGAAQLPYGGAPVIPTGLEGEGAYPYAAQHLSLEAESAKAASKYGAGVPYGPQQTGYGAQLGATQDALDETAKYGGNGGLANGYKG